MKVLFFVCILVPGICHGAFKTNIFDALDAIKKGQTWVLYEYCTILNPEQKLNFLKTFLGMASQITDEQAAWFAQQKNSLSIAAQQQLGEFIEHHECCVGAIVSHDIQKMAFFFEHLNDAQKERALEHPGVQDTISADQIDWVIQHVNIPRSKEICARFITDRSLIEIALVSKDKAKLARFMSLLPERQRKDIELASVPELLRNDNFYLLYPLFAHISDEEKVQHLLSWYVECASRFTPEQLQFYVDQRNMLHPGQQAQVPEPDLEKCFGKAEFFDETLLIVNYNNAFYDSIPLLRKLYAPYFKHMVFYGPEAHSDVHQLQHHMGYLSYVCISDAMVRYPDHKYYLFLHDDCILNAWFLKNLDPSKIWAGEIESGLWPARGNAIDLSKGLQAYPQMGHWTNEWGYSSINAAAKDLPDRYRKILEANWGRSCVAAFYSDIALVPATYREQYIELAEIFGKHRAHLELALPTILSCLSPKESWVWLGVHWMYQRENVSKEWRADGYGNHPVKLSFAANRELISKIFEHYKPTMAGIRPGTRFIANPFKGNRRH